MTGPDPDEARVEGIRAIWSSGSYEAVGDMFASIGQDLVDELDVSGAHVLDAACGTGNTTLALARAGATVVGVDITPRLLDVARARAEAQGLAVEWREGDLIDLPAADDTFDLVTSTFGAFTADDPFACARELARVCRPGGTIAVTAWARGGPFDHIRQVVTRVHPAFADVPRPDAEAWATADGLHERFAATRAELHDLDHREFAFSFSSLEAAWAFWEANSGPVQMARAGIEQVGGDWDEVRAGVIAAWEPQAVAVEGGIALRASYARALLTVT